MGLGTPGHQFHLQSQQRRPGSQQLGIGRDGEAAVPGVLRGLQQDIGPHTGRLAGGDDQGGAAGVCQRSKLVQSMT